jgi:hypothetical protein
MKRIPAEYRGLTYNQYRVAEAMWWDLRLQLPPIEGMVYPRRVCASCGERLTHSADYCPCQQGRGK